MSSTSSGAPAYALYRATGLGSAFVQSVSEMYQEQEMTNDQVIQALITFDRIFNQKIADKSPVNKLTMEGQLSNYRFVDGVWTLNLKGAQFHGAEGTIAVPNIKVVACEAKSRTRRTAAAARK